MSGKDDVLAFLAAHPSGWHYGLSIAAAAKVSRAAIYIHLGALEEEGKIERRLETLAPALAAHQLPRPLYRITRTGLHDTPGDAGQVFA